ncbi:MAG: DUF1847 domain-containing protein [Myxococcales bacterium]|nr:MAG: DUF1847 domain-containing protein [Myxococcales bacterium]
MRFALPTLNGRIAPRPTTADKLLLVDPESVGRRVESLPLDDPSLTDLLALLNVHKADVLVCCGIDRSSKREINNCGIETIENVACAEEEAIEAIFENRLQSGYGLCETKENAAAQPPPDAEQRARAFVRGGAVIGDRDCAVFNGRPCNGGLNCPFGDLPRAEETRWSRTMLDAAQDVALQGEPSLCRLSEVVYFCLEMKYRKIGLAFCADLEEPARVAASVLKRFFDVVSVCCKVRGASETPAAGQDHQTASERERSRLCNPLGQAQVLNGSECEFIILVGLCVGADSILTKASQAPATTLFVKDKVLANNPIGAVYSKRYLKEAMRTAPNSSGGPEANGR